MRKSAADVTSKVGEILQEFATNVRNFLRNPCKVGPLAALFGLFVAIPTSLFFMFSYCFLFPFPLPSEDTKNDT